MKGGSYGAADNGVQLYGFNQSAIPGSGNMIAINANAIQRGGSKLHGGYIVSRKSKSRSRKNRRMKTGGEGGSMPNFPSDLGQMGAATNTTTPLVQSITLNNPHSGGGIITDIAVPAVLLTANHLYNPKRKSKKSKRTKRKSRRR